MAGRNLVGLCIRETTPYWALVSLLGFRQNHFIRTETLLSFQAMAHFCQGLSIEAAFQEAKPITIVIDNNGGLDCISQQQERLFANGKHFATDFRDIPFHAM